MANIDYHKDDLIQKLWLVKAQEAKRIFYPRRKKNARMNLFTLSDGLNLNEIYGLEQNNLIEREDSVACVTTMIKRARLEAESVGYAVDGHINDQAFWDSSNQLFNRFPFDILNLDYCSQDFELMEGRIEEEVRILENIIKIQSEKHGEKFLLIFTTAIDPSNINTDEIMRVSNAINVNGWSGLNLDGFQNPLCDLASKKKLLDCVINNMTEKYGYKYSKGISSISRNNPANSVEIISIAGIALR